MNDITLYTIGSGGKSAEQFFTLLRKSGVKTMIDVRLKNTSHLAGFTKKQDLPFFLNEICGIGYLHIPLLAPTEEILIRYKKEKGPWENYVSAFNRLLEHRRAETLLSGEQLDRGCLLCSEPLPARCHRRLAAEYLASRIPRLQVIHL